MLVGFFGWKDSRLKLHMLVAPGARSLYDRSESRSTGERFDSDEGLILLIFHFNLECFLS